jgi:hypothetical protein
VFLSDGRRLYSGSAPRALFRLRHRFYQAGDRSLHEKHEKDDDENENDYAVRTLGSTPPLQNVHVETTAAYEDSSMNAWTPLDDRTGATARRSLPNFGID